MNRHDRRKQAKQTPKYERLTPEQQRARLYKNGITAKDVKDACDAAYEQGAEDSVRLCYAALMIVAKRLLKFGAIRRTRLLNEVDKEVSMAINGVELMQRVEKEMGYKIMFRGDPLESRIRSEVEL